MSIVRAGTAVLLLVICFTSTAHGYTGYCSSFCDYNGYYHQGKFCETPPFVYCCGNEYWQACCANATYDITNHYTDVYYCDNSTWWIFNWQVILGLLAAITVLLLCSACCCKLCYRGHYLRRIRHPDEILTVSENVGDSGQPPRPDVFNPESQYAFTPPEYNSLPKDPPKYEEVNDMAHFNQAYVPDQQTASHTQQQTSGHENETTQQGTGQVTGPSTVMQDTIPDGPPPSYTETESSIPPGQAAP